MSFTEMTLSDVVKKQYRFKLHANIGVFGSLILLQFVGLLFSLGGIGGYGSYSETYSIDIGYYSADVIIVFTILWAFISSVTLTLKTSRYEDFMFISTRGSSHLANVLFLITASVIGALTANFTGYLLKIIVFFTQGEKMGEGIFLAPGDFAITFLAVSLYCLLFASIGYLVGMIFQIHPIFKVLLPAVLLGVVIVTTALNENAMKQWISFIFFEHHLGLFFVKVMFSSALLFSCAMLISNRLEVRT